MHRWMAQHLGRWIWVGNGAVEFSVREVRKLLVSSDDDPAGPVLPNKVFIEYYHSVPPEHDITLHAGQENENVNQDPNQQHLHPAQNHEPAPNPPPIVVVDVNRAENEEINPAIEEHFSDDDNLIGVLLENSPLFHFKTNAGKDYVRLTAKLQDLNGEVIQVTLFDEFANQLINYLATHADEPHYVIIVQYLATVDSPSTPSYSRASSGITYSLEEDFLKVSVFNHTAEVKGIQEANKVVILGTIIMVYPTWYYMACPHCMRIVEVIEEPLPITEGQQLAITDGQPLLTDKNQDLSLSQIEPNAITEVQSIAETQVQSGASADVQLQVHSVATTDVKASLPKGSVTYKCKNEDCNRKKKVIEPFPRFKIMLKVQDLSGTVELTLFDGQAVRILHKSAIEVKDKFESEKKAMLPESENMDENDDVARKIPTDLQALLERKYAFKIDVSDFNIKKRYKFYTVVKMTDDQAIIKALDDKYNIEQHYVSDSVKSSSKEPQSNNFGSEKDAVMHSAIDASKESRLPNALCYVLPNKVFIEYYHSVPPEHDITLHGNKISGTCLSKWLNRFQRFFINQNVLFIKRPLLGSNNGPWRIVEHPLKLSFNVDTHVGMSTEWSGDYHFFNFTDFRQIKDLEASKTSSIDLIGVLLENSPLFHFKTNAGQDSVRLTAKLQDLNGEVIQVTLFDEFAHQLINYLATHADEPHYVIIVQFARFAVYKDRDSVSNAFNGTNVFINSADVKEISDYLERYLATVDSPSTPSYSRASSGITYSLEEDFLKVSVFNDTAEVEGIQEANKVVILGTIIMVYPTWYYMACPHYGQPLLTDQTQDLSLSQIEPNAITEVQSVAETQVQSGASADVQLQVHPVATTNVKASLPKGSVTYKCKNEDCNRKKKVIEPFSRFKIMLKVQDSSGTIELTLFNGQAVRILKLNLRIWTR
ncbi:hypothetical protein SSX86_029811 [Deinandra increscens subsp. villosa]|uniref:Uncharacterized protein n=1 Tax=Deinandra increscens subsp. villosa TaxID=3103831 RepID=A0AAP0CAA8_9ASTR